jgi:hypothetical protein
MSGLAGNALLLTALVAAVLAICYVVWHVAIAVGRAEAERAAMPVDATLDFTATEPEQPSIDMALQDYREAHTLIHLDPESGASVTLNIAKIECHSSVDYTFIFLQPIEPASLRVRLLAGTPPMHVLSCNGYEMQARFEESPEIVKLRILGTLIPLIRNNFPDGTPAQNAARAGGGVSQFRLH